MKWVACLVLPALLAGCALRDRAQEPTAGKRQADAGLHGRHPSHPGAPAGQARHVPRPWLAGSAQALAHEPALPPALRKNVHAALLFADGGLDLTEIADRLAAATGIPVQVLPEALLPADAFMPRMPGNLSGRLRNALPDKVWLRGEPAPLASMLDRIAARLGVWWKYENRRLQFYRMETRVFDPHAPAPAAVTQASPGPGCGPHEAAAVKARIELFLSRAGSAWMDPGAGNLLVVNDTPAVLQKIADHLAHQNRRIAMRHNPGCCAMRWGGP